MTDTVLLPSLATVAVTVPVAVSITETVLLEEFATYAVVPSELKATPHGVVPTGIDAGDGGLAEAEVAVAAPPHGVETPGNGAPGQRWRRGLELARRLPRWRNAGDRA